MSGKVNVLGLSITNSVVLTVFLYLIALALPYYANEYKLCIPSDCRDWHAWFLNVVNFVKTLIKGGHFAIMAMTTGVLAQETGPAYNVLEFYYSKDILFRPFYMLTGFIVAIAPLSTLTALASLLSERVSSSLRLFVVRSNKKMIFYDASVENLHIAKYIKNENNGIRFVFCRSGSDEIEQTPERKTLIRNVWGICLPDAETYYNLKGKNIYLISTDNLRTAYEYVNNLTSISERVAKILILANDAEDRIEMVENADPENDPKDRSKMVEDADLGKGSNYQKYFYFSFWETVAGKMYKDMNDNEILFILGDEGLQRAFLNRIRKEYNKSGDNKKKLQLVVFPSSEREYRIFSLMKEGEYKQLYLRIIGQVSFQDTVDKTLIDYIEKFEPQKERHIILLYKNIETNVNLKRYISRQYRKRVLNKNLTIMTYCDDPIIQKEEEYFDNLILGGDSNNKIDTRNMIRYYGVKEFLINEIMEEEKWKKAVNILLQQPEKTATTDNATGIRK